MQRALLAILLLLLGLGMVTSYQIHTLGPLVRDEPLNVRLTDMQELSSTWTSGGVEHRLTTTREAEESNAAFVARHDVALEAALTQYPPDE